MPTPTDPNTGAYVLTFGGSEAGQPQYLGLPCAAYYNTQYGSPQMVACYTFSAEERAAIAGGANVYIAQLTFGNPLTPLQVTVGPDVFLVENGRPKGGWLIPAVEPMAPGMPVRFNIPPEPAEPAIPISQEELLALLAKHRLRVDPGVFYRWTPQERSNIGTQLAHWGAGQLDVTNPGLDFQHVPQELRDLEWHPRSETFAVDLPDGYLYGVRRPGAGG